MRNGISLSDRTMEVELNFFSFLILDECRDKYEINALHSKHARLYRGRFGLMSEVQSRPVLGLRNSVDSHTFELPWVEEGTAK